MATTEFKWQGQALDTVRVRSDWVAGTRSATVYIPDGQSPEKLKETLEKLQQALGENSIGAFADVEAGRHVLRLTHFQDQNELFEVLGNARLIDPENFSERKISDKELRQQGALPPKAPRSMVQNAAILGQLGLGIIVGQGVFNRFMSRRMKDTIERDGEYVSRPFRLKFDGGFPKIVRDEYRIDEAERQKLDKIGKAEIGAGAKYTTAMLTKMVFGGGVNTPPYDEILRGAMNYLEVKDMALGDSGWLGPDQAVKRDKNVLGKAADFVRQNPIEVVDLLVIAGNYDTTMAGFKEIATTKEKRVNILKKQIEEEVEAGLSGTLSGSQRDAIIAEEVEKRLASPEMQEMVNDAGKFSLMQDFALNYRLWGGGLSLLTDVISVGVPEATPEEIEKMKESDNPIERSELYQNIRRSPLAFNKYLGMVDKPMSAYAGFQSERFVFTQMGAVVRNFFFAAYRLVVSFGSKGNASADYEEKLNPIYTMTANVLMEEPAETFGTKIENMAEYYSAYLLGKGYVPMSKQATAEEKEAKKQELKETITAGIQSKLAELQQSPWLTTLQADAPSLSQQQGVSQHAPAPDMTLGANAANAAMQASMQPQAQTSTDVSLADQARQGQIIHPGVTTTQ